MKQKEHHSYAKIMKKEELKNQRKTMINIKELSVDNWIQNTNGNVGKVIGITEQGEVIMRYTENSTCFSEPNMLKPIPVTEEILKKNGWVKMSGSLYSCLYKDAEFGEQILDMIDMDDHWDLDINDLFVIEIKHIHQLQNALTLCGINKEIGL